jgi:hypothetical protein
MKKAALILIAVLFALACAACGPAASTDASPAPGGVDGKAGEGDTADGQQAGGKTKSDLYDPSIFIIEASGTWRQELAPGYFADYECEFYIDKTDANDNRDEAGLYTGVFWMKTTLDTDEYLDDLLKDVPADVQLDAGGEGICDNLTVHLRADYNKEEWADYSVPDDKGNMVQPAAGVSVAKGEFIAVGKAAYLEARAQGAQGEKLDYKNSGASDEELSYVLQVAPDAAKTATQRSVTIYLSNGKGMSATLKGKMRIQPGYPEDMLEYTNAGKQQEILDKHI